MDMDLEKVCPRWRTQDFLELATEFQGIVSAVYFSSTWTTRGPRARLVLGRLVVSWRTSDGPHQL